MHDHAEIAGLRVRAIALAVTALLVCGAAHHAAAQNLVQNPGFESTSTDGGNTSPGWTLTNSQGDTTFVDDASTAHTGSWSVQFAATDAASAAQGMLSQSIATVPQTTYVVSFYLANEGGPHNSFVATFGGQTVLSLTDADAFTFKQYSATIKATSATSALAFVAQQDPSDFILDDVSVEAEGAPLPPAGAGLLSFGVAFVGLALRRVRAGRADRNA